MRTSEILELDYREHDDRLVVQNVLRKIKPFANIPKPVEVPVAKLEKCLQVLSHKYDYVVSIHLDPVSNNSTPIWRCAVVRYGQSVGSGTNVWGTSLYEVLAKAIILVYGAGRRQTRRRQTQ